MSTFFPKDAYRLAVDVVTAGLNSGSIKLLGPGSATMENSALINSGLNAESDAKYLNDLVNLLAGNLTLKQ